MGVAVFRETLDTTWLDVAEEEGQTRSEMEVRQSYFCVCLPKSFIYCLLFVTTAFEFVFTIFLLHSSHMINWLPNTFSIQHRFLLLLSLLSARDSAVSTAYGIKNKLNPTPLHCWNSSPNILAVICIMTPTLLSVCQTATRNNVVQWRHWKSAWKWLNTAES